jgi:hypothetical protein
MTIGVLYHEKEKELQHLYYIDHFIRVWRIHGHKVLKLYCTHQIEENPDLIIVHIDLSVVPDEYFEYYSRSTM